MTRPQFLTETDEAPPWTDCDRRSFAMAVNHALGRTATNGEDLDPELHGPRPTYQSNGHDPCADNAERLYGVHFEFGWFRWTDVEQAWSEGRGVVLHMVYGEVQAPFDRFDPSYAGGHAVYAPEPCFVMDPLGRGSYAGQAWPEDMLRHACESFTDGSHVQCAIGPVIPEAAGGGDPMLNLGGYVSFPGTPRLLLRATLTEDPTPLWASPGVPLLDAHGNQVTLRAGTRVWAIGHAPGHVLVLVNTAQGWEDHVARPSGVYVLDHQAELDEAQPTPQAPRLPRAQ